MKKINKRIIILFLTFTVVSIIYAGLQDRAFATHNIGKVGYFTTNIGQFYPYGGQFESTLEYPINSGHIAMYRQCIMLGVPYNVISAADGRFEEFDAVGGYNASDGNIAMSDNPTTWPATGWPVKDENGDPIIISQQDSYCVYSDSTNWRYTNNGEQDKLLDLRIHQSIYSWGVPGADKFVILKFELENNSSETYEDMYFNFYSDLDIGGNANDTREWADDCIGFDKEKELVYFYDSDNYSSEWEETDPFLSGIIFLETPNNQGITDWHWIDVYTDEVAVNSGLYDSLSYNLMRSDTTYFHDNPNLAVSDYFHLGENPIDGTHYDDPETTRILDESGNLVGGAMVAYIANGPFNIEPGERAEIIVASIVGDNETDLIDVTNNVWEYYNKGFDIPIVPTPNLSGESSDQEVSLFWSDSLDVTYQNPANNDINDLEGYIIYRTTDPTLTDWFAVDTIEMIYKDNNAVNSTAYEYQDTGLINGFTYYYSLSAYRFNIAGKIEESTRLSDLRNIDNQINAILVDPASLPASAKDDLDKIRVVPNPFIVSAQWDEARLGNSPFGEPVRAIAFTNLPEKCTIRIFTVDGDLVQKIEHNSSTGREEWNLLTNERRPIVSGVYFYHVESDLGDKAGRFAVIR